MSSEAHISKTVIQDWSWQRYNESLPLDDDYPEFGWLRIHTETRPAGPRCELREWAFGPDAPRLQVTSIIADQFARSRNPHDVA